ncbi:MAG: CTP synthase [Pseudomonadota bacterium]|nr:CTP synthase [Pseudomonadota bacterium]
MKTKYLFVTGGVLSSLGKGLSAAAIGALMEARGFRVANVKMDPYINVDPGTMSPYQHGEVFVTEDGAETDLDLGHYERFVARPTTQKNSFTTGRIYRNVIESERRGEYLGRTVQVIPHITDEIKRLIHEAVAEVDIAIIEIGGTVGDIESLPFLEAIRQMRADVGPENVLYIHVTLVPYIRAAGEMKTKPTQHSVKELLSIGIQPDILVCRSEKEIPKDLRQKIASFCNVGVNDVISAPDVENIYQLPLVFHDQGLDDRLLQRLNAWAMKPHLEKWVDYCERARAPHHTVRVAVVGKYVHLTDTYKSLNEALAHGGIANDARIELRYVDSEEIDESRVGALLNGVDAVLIPGGFGTRGIEGKILAIRHAREAGIPFFGICLGMQLAVVEYLRHVGGLPEAHSAEFAPQSAHLVVHMMDSQRRVVELGGTMRLGTYPCLLRSGTRARQIYGSDEIQERHRHRYEVNPAYHARLEEAGMVISGTSPDGKLVEMIEVPTHPYFVACQFHPEFKSRPLAPHPLFTAFIRAALERQVRVGREASLAGPAALA